MIGKSPLLETRDRSERAAARPRGKSRRAKIGAFLLTTVLTLVAFEAVLVMLPRALMPPALRAIETFNARRAEWQLLTTGDPHLGFKLRPDIEVRFPFEGGAFPIRTTSHGLGQIGFRDIGTQPPFGAIAIGDSFTYCDEVPPEDCWVRRLAEASGLSIATLGVPGYSTLAEARMLKRYGSALAPRLVLVGVFPNDLADNVNFDEWARSGTGDLNTWLQRVRGRHPLVRWLEEHWTTYRLLSVAVRARGREIHRHQEGDLDLMFRFDDWWMAVFKAPDRHPGWPLMQDALLDMRQAAADMRAQLVVLIFPTKEEAYWDIARRYVPAPEALDVDGLPRLLTRFLADHAIVGCDLTGELRREARRGRQLYYRVSGHFNAEGNRVTATAIARCLATRHLLDAGQRSGFQPDGTR